MNPSHPVANGIQEITIPGFHQVILRVLTNHLGKASEANLLDAGAGHGALSHQLKQLGYRVSACDLNPELFQAKDVEFRQADISRNIPWENESFDGVVAVEVTEHLDQVLRFFQEVHRVLKPEGFFLFSTPNILSLKSRIRFLLSGYCYSFHPISDQEQDAVRHHITPLPYELYELRLRWSGFTVSDIFIDKRQRSSLAGMILYPCICLYCLLKLKSTSSSRIQNRPQLLLGRTLIIWATKQR